MAKTDANANEQGSKSRDWGIYEGPWPYKCATQLPDEEVLPRLRRYLELGERRLPYFLKPMNELTPVEQLAVVAAINACASSIFNQCTTVRGQWERTYQPDLTSPNNKEKLKKFSKIVKSYPNRELLPLLESLVEQGKESEAFQVLKSIRKLAHVNKNGSRKNSVDQSEPTREIPEEMPSRKKQKVTEPYSESRSYSEAKKSPPRYDVGFPGLMRAAEEESRRESQEFTYRLPPLGGYHSPSSHDELTSENSMLRSEVRALSIELYEMRRRLAYFENCNSPSYSSSSSSNVLPRPHFSSHTSSFSSSSMFGSSSFPASHFKSSPKSSPTHNSDGENESHIRLPQQDKGRVMSIMNPSNE